MRLILLLLAFFATPLLAETPAATQFESKIESVLTVRGQVEIGPDGKVLTHELAKDTSKGVADLIGQNVALWRFEPITRNGKPVIARTAMTLNVSAREGADGAFSLRLENVWFGGRKIKSALRQPRYPSSAISAGLGARVWLLLELDPTGKVVTVHPYQTSLTRRMRESRAARWRSRFERASIEAAKHWGYEPAELFDGAQAGRFFKTPIDFKITLTDGRRRGPEWEAFVPGPINPSAIFDATALIAENDADMPAGDLLPLVSPFKLRVGAPESL